MCTLVFRQCTKRKEWQKKKKMLHYHLWALLSWLFCTIVGISPSTSQESISGRSTNRRSTSRSSNYSAEYRALCNLTDKIIRYISQDELKELCPKLFTGRLIGKIEKKDTAGLIESIIKKVEVIPANFNTFINALNEIPSLQVLADLITDEYEKIKRESLGSAKVRFSCKVVA